MNQPIITEQLPVIQQVPTVDKISTKDFYNDFVAKSKPVIIKNYTSLWKALDWDIDFFRKVETGTKLAVKVGKVSKGEKQYMTMSEYGGLIENYEQELKQGRDPIVPGYLHDVPFFHLFPHLKSHIEPFPIHLFPHWYWDNWHNYIQFFMGTTGSLTPLHFDTLCTNNLFFQLVGEKKFILIPAEQKSLCYMEGWRWAKFNPDKPDFDKHPLAKNVSTLEAYVGPGDILYIPSGMLHQVHGLSFSISFNIDWHTAKSAAKGVLTVAKGAPLKNGYYNALSFLGLGLKVPSKYIFPHYKSYLNYIS